MADEFVRYHRRTTDPETSSTAAKVASIRSGAHKHKILEALSTYDLLTFEEVATRTGLRESASWKRLSDLKNEGRVRVFDELGVTRQGVSCSRYIITGPGISDCEAAG